MTLERSLRWFLNCSTNGNITSLYHFLLVVIEKNKLLRSRTVLPDPESSAHHRRKVEKEDAPQFDSGLGRASLKSGRLNVVKDLKRTNQIFKFGEHFSRDFLARDHTKYDHQLGMRGFHGGGSKADTPDLDVPWKKVYPTSPGVFPTPQRENQDLGGKPADGSE
jgi:hypothetical protein